MIYVIMDYAKLTRNWLKFIEHWNCVYSTQNFKFVFDNIHEYRL